MRIGTGVFEKRSRWGECFLYSENDGGLRQENKKKSLVSCTKMHIFLYSETDEILDTPNKKNKRK